MVLRGCGVMQLLFTSHHMCLFFFSSRRRHTRFDCDWSSDVCSSDLSYRNRITDQISRSVRKSSHFGIAEFHGVPSRGSPGPPLATRQNTKLSVSCAMVPLSWKLAGSGLKPDAKCP